MPERRRILLLAATLLLGAGLVAGGGPGAVPGRPAPAPWLTIFMIDGLSATVFEEELAAGRLPALSRLVAEGRYVPAGIAAFPTMTGYGFYPLITGHDAAGSGVLGLRWYDRDRPSGNFRNYVGRTNRAMNGDLVPVPRTLFECFPGQHSFSVNSYLNRGVHEAATGTWQYTAAKYRTRHWLTNGLRRIPWLGRIAVPDWQRADSTTVAQAIDDLPNRPKVQWLTLMSPDAHSHIHGMDSAYRERIRQIDGLIAGYRRESAALGQEQNRLYLIASDHGVVDVAANIDLREPLGRLGLQTWRGPATYFRMAELDRPQASWEDTDVVEAINGNTMAYLYLLSDAARARPAEIAGEILATEGVSLVIRSGEAGGVLVEGPAGRGAIERRDGALAYRVLEGTDPLEYCLPGSPTEWCDGTPHTAEAWLTATRESRYPYAVPRIDALMAQPDAGDLVVTAGPGFDLGADYEMVVGNYRGGHGGLDEPQIRVPYVLAGPGIAAGEVIPVARAEDIGRELVERLGCQPGTGPAR